MQSTPKLWTIETVMLTRCCKLSLLLGGECEVLRVGCRKVGVAHSISIGIFQHPCSPICIIPQERRVVVCAEANRISLLLVTGCLFFVCAANRVTNQAAMQFAVALRCNRTLQILSLSSVPFSYISSLSFLSQSSFFIILFPGSSLFPPPLRSISSWVVFFSRFVFLQYFR